MRVEADKVRSLNRYMEQKAWGAFRYEVFPAYDFAPIAATLKKEHARLKGGQVRRARGGAA